MLLTVRSRDMKMRMEVLNHHELIMTHGAAQTVEILNKMLKGTWVRGCHWSATSEDLRTSNVSNKDEYFRKAYGLDFIEAFLNREGRLYIKVKLNGNIVTAHDFCPANNESLMVGRMITLPKNYAASGSEGEIRRTGT